MDERQHNDYLSNFFSVEETGLQHILNDPTESALFKRYLDDERSSEHLLFWMEAEVFRSTDLEDKELVRRAIQIYQKYFHADSPYEINVNSTILAALRKRMNEAKQKYEQGEPIPKAKATMKSRPKKEKEGEPEDEFLPATPLASSPVGSASPSASFLSVAASGEKTFGKRVTKTDDDEEELVDSMIFVPAQTSVFNLMEMDSFPRFINSDIYQTYKEGKRDKDLIEEDLTFLIARMQHADLGVGKLLNNHECFLASDFVTWIVQALYMLDRRAAVRMAQKLQERGVIVCTQQSNSFASSSSFYESPSSSTGTSSLNNSYTSLPGLSGSYSSLPTQSSPSSVTSSPSSSSGTLGHSFLKLWSSSEESVSEQFEDNNALWKFVKKPSTNDYKAGRDIPTILNNLPFKACERKSFPKVLSLVNLLLDNTDMFTKIVSSSWAINRAERDKFASCISKILYDSGRAIPVLHSMLESNFQKKDLGALKYGELSVINKILMNYFSLVGGDYIRSALSVLFSKPTFERELCFDLRSKTEDQSVNQIEFLKLLKLVVDPLFSNDMLEKIPSDIREIGAILANLCNQYAAEKFFLIVGGFWLRSINRALLRPDLHDIVSTPYIPLPRVKENLFLVTRVLENLITGNKFHAKLYGFMSFTNNYVEEKRSVLADYLQRFCSLSSEKKIPAPVNLLINFSEYANLISILKNNDDKLNSLLRQEADGSFLMIGNRGQESTIDFAMKKQVSIFFSLLKELYTLLKNGESNKVKLFYCPIFSDSKMVLDFCLANSIPFEPHKIEYLFGDFKEDPILTDADISVSGSTEIIRFLSDKYCITNEFFYQVLNPAAENNSVSKSTAPARTQNDNFAIGTLEDIDPFTFTGSKEEFRMKLRNHIDQYLQWNQYHIKHPIQQIFWKETYPRFNATNKIKSAKIGEKSEKENTVGVKSTTIAERMDVLTLESSYVTLAESLTVLDNILNKKEKKGKFLVTKSIMSIADVVVAEQLSAISLFNGESLDAYPFVRKWFQTVKELVPFWNVVNSDFDTFVQYTIALSDNDPTTCMEQSVGLVNWTPKQVYDKVAYFANKKSFNNINITKATSRSSINLNDIRSDNVPDLVPERTVITNYRSEHILPGHLSTLEYCVSGISGTSNVPVTKLIFNMINVPPNKTKNISEDWTKIWKQMSGIFLGDFTSMMYFQLPVYAVYELLLNGDKLGAATKTKCNIAAKVGYSFSLFDNTVMGANTMLYVNDLVVQRWRIIDWPEDHYSTVKYKLQPYVLNGSEVGTYVSFTQTNVPLDRLKETKNKQKQFWKKVKAELIDNISQDVYFQDMAPMQVYELFLSTESASPSSFQLVKCTTDVPNVEVTRVFRANDWPIGHQSKVTINLFQLGDRDVRRKKVTKLVLIHENVPKAKVKNTAESWEKHYWKKMKGIITADISQSIIFNLTSPADVYENLLNFSKFTKQKCSNPSSEVGEVFSLYDDTVQGRSVKLVKNQMIVFKWRFNDWPEDHFGTVQFVLKPLQQLKTEDDIEEERKSNKGPVSSQITTTKLFFACEAIPVGKAYTNAVAFWTKFWKTFRSANGGIASGVLPNKLTKK